MPTADLGQAREAALPPAIECDRRTSPDRRDSWRGGRRDSDWINRPPGALERFQQLHGRGRRFRHFVLSLW